MMLFNLIKKNKAFKNFFLSELISGFGSGMSFIALNWYVLKQTGSSSQVGKYFALMIIWGFIITPFSGAITDTFNRKKVIIILNFLRGFLLLLLAIISWSSDYTPWILYLLTFVTGVGWSMYSTTSKALIQELLSKKDLKHGNSIVEICTQVGIFISAGCTGFIYDSLGFWFIIIIDSITFFISLFFLLVIEYKPKTKQRKEKKTPLSNYMSGLKYLKNNKIILLLGIILFLPFSVTMATNVILPDYISNSLKESSKVFGIADMLYGIGAFLSGFLIYRIANIINSKKLLYILFMLSVFSLLLISLNKSSTLYLYLLYLVLGFILSGLRIELTTIAMNEVNNDLFGSVMAVWLAISFLMQIILTSTIGKLAEQFSSNIGYFILSVIMFFTLCLYYFYKKLSK